MPVPQHDGDLLSRSKLLKEGGKYPEAIELLEQFLSREPDNVGALEELADAELSAGHYERADAAASRALALSATSFASHYIRGFVASHGEQWAASITAFQAANALEQNHPEILRCLGWSLFNTGKTVEGVVTLERSLNLEQDNPLTLCDLGVVCLQLEEYAKAKSLFKRALDVDPTNDRAKECLMIASRIEKHAAASHPVSVQVPRTRVQSARRETQRQY